MKMIYSFCIIGRQISHLTLVWASLLGCNRWWSCRNRHLEWNRLLFTSTQYFCVIISSDRTRIRNHRCKLDKIRCLRYLCHSLNSSYLNPCVLFAWNVFLLWKTAGVARAQFRRFLVVSKKSNQLQKKKRVLCGQIIGWR